MTLMIHHRIPFPEKQQINMLILHKRPTQKLLTLFTIPSHTSSFQDQYYDFLPPSSGWCQSFGYQGSSAIANTLRNIRTKRARFVHLRPESVYPVSSSSYPSKSSPGLLLPPSAINVHTSSSQVSSTPRSRRLISPSYWKTNKLRVVRKTYAVAVLNLFGAFEKPSHTFLSLFLTIFITIAALLIFHSAIPAARLLSERHPKLCTTSSACNGHATV